MAHGAVFGERGGEEWSHDQREELALADWRGVLSHPEVAVHVDCAGRSSLHRRGVLTVAEDDLDDERLIANLDDLGVPRQLAGATQTGPSGNGTIERTGLGFAFVPIGRNLDAVAAARFLRSLEGRRPLRVGPDHLLSPSQGTVLGPAGPPQPASPGRGVLKRRQATATVVPSVRVGVIDSGLVAGPLSDPLLAAGLMATVASNPEPDPLWDGAQLMHWEGGHGTHVAGVLAAAAGGAASILHFAVLQGNGLPVPLVSDSQAAVAVARALAEGCRVVNLSLSGPTAADFDTIATSLVLGRAAGSGKRRKKGDRSDDAVLVAAAGNEATSEPRYPAALKGVVGVGALDLPGTHRARFSNFGPWVDCCAVGVDVFGPYVTGLGGPMPDGSQPAFKGWATWSGTSFATPYVSGLIAAAIAAGTTSARVAAASVLAAGTPMPLALGLGVKVA